MYFMLSIIRQVLNEDIDLILNWRWMGNTPLSIPMIIFSHANVYVCCPSEHKNVRKEKRKNLLRNH